MALDDPARAEKLTEVTNEYLKQSPLAEIFALLLRLNGLSQTEISRRLEVSRPWVNEVVRAIDFRRTRLKQMANEDDRYGRLLELLLDDPGQSDILLQRIVRAQRDIETSRSNHAPRHISEVTQPSQAGVRTLVYKVSGSIADVLEWRKGLDGQAAPFLMDVKPRVGDSVVQVVRFTFDRQGHPHELVEKIPGPDKEAGKSGLWHFVSYQES
jgi:predicted XRE-type DNA-binding protein